MLYLSLDGYIRQALQSFLGFAPGGIGSDAHVIFSCHPRALARFPDSLEMQPVPFARFRCFLGSCV